MIEALRSLPLLWNGLLVTLTVSAIAATTALVLGVSFGASLVYAPRWLAWPIRLYCDVIRGIPVLVLIFFVYYGLPSLGIETGSFAAGVVALAAFQTAHVAEVARGAIQAIPVGQTEAAKALGLKFEQRFAYVILPLAARRFFPPFINIVVDTVKGSALISLVGVVDLMLAIQQSIGRTFAPMPFYLIGAAGYFAINFSLSMISRRLEARFAYVRE
jgi:polar amino acid transport system permease protein